MPQRIDLETWSRREQYRFFMGFDQPFFNLCTELEAGAFHRAVKKAGHSFYLACIHAALTAARQVPAFRYRLDDQGVVDHDPIHAAAAVLGEGDAFRFCWLDFEADFAVFQERGKPAMEAAAKATGPLEPHAGRVDLIHFSVLPWIRFTGLGHPRTHGTRDSVPKIVFGRCHDNMNLPISIDVHHALADGVHVAKFLKTLQGILQRPTP